MRLQKKINNIFEGRGNIILLVSLIFALIFSLLYFNTGIHPGGDDAGYVLRAMRLWERGEFPAFQGEVYPVLLAPFYGLSNGNLVFLRILSIPMLLGSVYFLFKIYRIVLQPAILFMILLILSINYYWLNYASLTYSEALFNLLQYGIIYYFSKRFIAGRISFKDVLLLSFMALLLLKTRSIGAGIFVAVFIFFLWEKRWRILWQFSLVSIVMIVIWEAMVLLIANHSGSLISSQIAGLLQVNPYDASQGSADFNLLFHRLVYNFNEYISKHIMQFLALRGSGILEANWIYTILLLIFVILAAILNRSRDRIIRFSLIYLGIVFFIVLLTPEMWSQARFMQPFIPIVFVVLVYELQQMTIKRYRVLPLAVLVSLFFLQSVQAVHFAGERIVDTRAFIQGDRFTDQTPDWQNYLHACEWIGENIDPAEGKVACRKPQIAALVSKQDNFHGIYSVPAYNCHTISELLMEEDRNFLTIDIEKFFEQPVPQSILDALQQSYSGGVWQNSGSTNFRIFSFYDQDVYEKIVEVNKQLDYLLPMETLIAEPNNYSVSFADSLLVRLKKNQVSYLLLANLRVYEEERTEEVLSGVFNYMKTLEMKYPGMFEEIYKVGEDSQEPTSVFRINYAPPKEGLSDKKLEADQGETDSYSSMCAWAEKHTEGMIICSGMGKYDIAASGRFFVLSAAPAMNYDQFSQIYRPGCNYIVMNPSQFDVERIDKELSSALLNSFYGFMYIGGNMFRLHQVDTKTLYNKIVNDPYISKYIFSYQMLQSLTPDQKNALYVIEPSYMLSEMKKRNIQYIITDSLIKENNQNIPKKLLFLIGRKYPDAFEKVKEQGRNEDSNVSLYKVNYKVMNH